MDYYQIHEYRYQFLEEQILELNLGNSAPKSPKVLDVGCYPPFLFDFLKKQGYDTYGIASNHEQMHDKNVKILNIETEKFPWPNNTFELVVFTEVLEHLPHSPLPVLKEMCRVLKPGGKLIITTPNAAKLHHRLQSLVGRSTSFPIDQLLNVKPNDGSLYHLHNREYTLSEVEKVLKLSGFSIARSEQVCLYPPTRSKNRQEKLSLKLIKWGGFALQQLYSPFRDSLLVIGEKTETATATPSRTN